MPEPYVTSATITGQEIKLSIRVDDFKPEENPDENPEEKTDAYVEISGQATQTGGAFANFYDIQQVPAEPNVLATDPSVTDGKDHYYVYVTGTPIPHQFMDEDVTVVVRVAKVWLTVLGRKRPAADSRTQGHDAQDGMEWSDVRKVVEIKKNKPSTHGGDGQQQAADPTSAG